jgi:acetyl-CoA carboxylase carboxyl transferase subunit alpha
LAKSWKEWEKPVLELDEYIAKLKAIAAQETNPDKHSRLAARLEEFEKRRDNFINIRYSRLGPWEEVLLARAEPRPYTLDYVAHLFTDFTELDGDRRHGQDHAIVAGPANFEGRPVMVVGHQKGRDIKQRAFRNFAMAKPEGYRKAIRMFDMAERFRLPVVTFVDTPAADPGVESESRGISEAIAASMLKMFELTVPIVSVIIGEGGSGGAIGIACANKLLMQEHAIYSVIPPEGCAAILWRDADKGPQAAAALKLTAQSAMDLELVDEILEEPFGGAHRSPLEAATTVRDAIERNLMDLDRLSPTELKEHRYKRFRKLGRLATV